MPILSRSELKTLTDAARKAHNEIWKRFLDPHDVMLDYTGLKGEVLLPTPEECAKNMPNALAWWTPIENGGFFNSDYLLGLLQAEKVMPDRQRRGEIRRLLEGLFRLQDVSRVEGCVARGLASDGHSHYPASSNDQVFPWLLALAGYRDSGFSTTGEKEECGKRLLRMLNALSRNGWRIPGDRAGFERGSFLNESNLLESRLSTVHYLGANWIWSRLDQDAAHFEQAANSVLGNGRVRKDLAAEGFPDLFPWQTWFTAHSVYALRELADADDPAIRTIGKHALNATAECVRNFPAGKWRETRSDTAFSMDWRALNTLWTEQSDCTAAQECALKQLPLWQKISPGLDQEKDKIRNPLSAAWILLMTGHRESILAALPEIMEEIRTLDCATLHDAGFFYLENVVAEIVKFSLE